MDVLGGRAKRIGRVSEHARGLVTGRFTGNMVYHIIIIQLYTSILMKMKFIFL